MDHSETPMTNKNGFNCPFCNAYAQQIWLKPDGRVSSFHGTDISDLAKFAGTLHSNSKSPYLSKPSDPLGSGEIVGIVFSRCARCERLAIWVGNRLVFPADFVGDPPNPDLPIDISKDYTEARSIAAASPRAAAGLLRLAIQKLCIHLGEKGKNINEDIASLVTKGLDPKIQKALDIVRVIGNESVHPGEIQIDDEPETTAMLFKLVNLIAEKMISEPNEIDALFKKLPESKRKAITVRDEKK